MPLVLDDLMAPEAINDPHTYYHQLRELERVHWNERWGGWVLTGYDDVVAVLRDSDRFSSDRMAYLETELNAEERCLYQPIFAVLAKWLVFIDPPDHTRIRRLLNTRFTPRAVEQYRPRVRSIVNNLLTEIEPRRRMEVIHEFAYLVPLTVILELLGAPALDRDLIKQWSEQIGTFFFLRADEPRRREIACEGVTSLVNYLRPLVAQRRESPTLDLISALVACEDQQELTEAEIIATCVLLVFGGHETTMNLIANGVLALANHPEEWDRLKADPKLIESAVEELLRYDGSVKATVRWARSEAVVGGKTIKAGQKVLCALSAANRDPEHFPEPDRLDITRAPNPHVAFGQGIHICLGAPLARLEAQEAIAGLTRRLPAPRISTPTLDYHPTVVSRALRNLPIEF
ncbi:MAG: cytochrome P450 [Phycisphaerales bacterium]|nr:cytochrome P450 [Phycisphaerales bacterium]